MGVFSAVRARAESVPQGPAPAAATTAAPKSDPLTLFGDVRFRFDVDSRSGTDVDDSADSRTQPRLRARLGAEYATPVAGLSFGLRLATNPGAPGNSPHQTFDADADGEPGNAVALDRAYLALALGSHGRVVVGKQAYPHWQQTEVFWDEDIQPEGFSGGYRRDLGAAGKVSADLGFFYIKNNGWTGKPFRDDTLATGQLLYEGAFGRLTPRLAVTGCAIRDVGAADNSDGTHVFGDATFVMASAQVSVRAFDVVVPLTVTAGLDFVHSTASASTMSEDHDQGWVAQLRLGEKRIAARYYYYDIQEASVPFWGPVTFSQDNFANSRGGGLTGFAGHRIQLDYAVGKGVAVDLRLYLQEGKAENVLAFSELPGRSIRRLQLNVDARF
jgi:hypothetical protein